MSSTQYIDTSEEFEELRTHFLLYLSHPETYNELPLTLAPDFHRSQATYMLANSFNDLGIFQNPSYEKERRGIYDFFNFYSKLPIASEEKSSSIYSFQKMEFFIRFCIVHFLQYIVHKKSEPRLNLRDPRRFLIYNESFKRDLKAMAPLTNNFDELFFALEQFEHKLYIDMIHDLGYANEFDKDHMDVNVHRYDGDGSYQKVRRIAH
jgi:hypothetical protein